MIDTTSGCRNSEPPDDWRNVNLSTHESYNLNIMDGNAICFRVKAEDIVGHTNETTVVVHVDSSPPEIPYLWLERDGEINLAVHNTKDFKQMKYVQPFRL